MKSKKRSLMQDKLGITGLFAIVGVIIGVIILAGFGLYFLGTLGNAFGGSVNDTITTLSTNTLGTGATGFTTIFPLVVLAVLIGIALSYVFNIIPRGRG